MPAVNFWAKVAYDGSAFFGWQQTKIGRSVQGTIKAAAEQIAGCPVQVEAASRTDRGVHAQGQLIGLYPESHIRHCESFLQSLSRILPNDIAMLEGGVAQGAWHPSIGTCGKRYRYWVSLQPEPLMRTMVWELPRRGWSPQELDMEAMQACANLLKGQRSFWSLATDKQRMPVRNPYCMLKSIELCWETPTLLAIWMSGDRFLYKMCRTIAGTIIQVGQRKLAIEGVQRGLATGDRSAVGMCAPACGLCLIEIVQSEAQLALRVGPKRLSG